jgi:hypothetical protein
MMKIKYIKDGRLKTMCPAGRECMVASQMCEDCMGFKGKDLNNKTVDCSIVSVRMLMK